MATISGSNSISTFTMKEFLGLNENPDGDTKLRFGEAAVMRNFKITRDKNLKTRPGNMMQVGLAQMYTIEEDPVLSLVTQEAGNGALLVYDSVFSTFEGKVELDGPVETPVTHENAAQFAGKYFKYGYFYYRLYSCLYNENTGYYEWYGYKETAESCSEDSNLIVRGMWSGYLNGSEEFLAACNGHLWKIYREDTDSICKYDLGEMDTSNRVVMFGYSGVCYILNGKDYYVYDGHCVRPVEGYRPLVVTATPPAGGGTELEPVNKLTGERRQQFSPDGTSTVYQLAGVDLLTIDYVKNTVTGEIIEPSEYTTDVYNGTVTFYTAPSGVPNSIEIGFTAANTQRAEVVSMTDYELFSGSSESRVILYGNGSNEFFYSSVDYDGNVRADYFPSDNETQVGAQNTPITAIVRHFSTLVAYKSDSAYSISYGTVTLSSGLTAEAFYVTPINKAIGNEASGQVQIVLNSPRTLYRNEIYEWKTGSSRTTVFSKDERQAIRISDRVYSTLKDFDFAKAICYDDNFNQEYYVCCGGTALVNNYAVDAWYKYDDLDVACMHSFRGKLYIGTNTGEIQLMSDEFRTNNGNGIDSYWESGSINFGRDYQMKNSSELWVVMKPESAGAIRVTVQTDKKSIYNEKEISTDIFDFGSVDFGHLSFNTNRKPHSARLKIKAKKFVFYKIIFETARPGTTATILSTNVAVRFSGKAK